MIIRKLSFKRWCCIITLIIFSHTANSTAEPLRIAVASNFTQALHEIASAFESQYQASLTISAASSGKHFAQIQHGAPFDVFLSADEDKVDRLLQSGHVLAEDSLVYSQGQLALYSNKSEFWPVTLDILQRPKLRLAIANPKLAPYGFAAQNLIDGMNVSPPITNIVTGENIAQTFHFTHSGNADAGLVALSQVINTQPKHHYKVIPQSLHQPILQKAAVLKGSQNKVQARRFLTFLKQDKAISIMQTYGYRAP